MMHRWGSPTRVSRIAQAFRSALDRPSFVPKVFLALILIATGLFMVASDSITHASPLSPKGSAHGGPSPTYPPANIVIADTPTPTIQATGTPTTATPKPGAPSNTIPPTGYTPPASNTKTPARVPTSVPVRPTPTPVYPTATPFPTATPYPTATPVPTETATPVPTATPTSDNASGTTATPTPTPVATAVPTDTPTPTAVVTDTPTPTATSVSTETPTATVIPTDTPTATPTETSTETPTPTETSTVTPTATVTVTPTATATVTPTVTTTITPTPSATCVASTTSTSNSASGTTRSVSPLLFGTNLALLNSQDQVLTSQQAQACLLQMHISIIRMPIRSGLDSVTIQTAAQTIKQLGATPLIVLHGPIDRNALHDDIAVIKIINNIFGNSTVYYEYGNNEDLLKISAKTYTDSWNANVPALKQQALNGLFIGPVTYQYRQDYLLYFLQKAAPQPDAVSWHAYACSRTQSNQTCIDNLKNWARDVQDAKHIMTSTIHKKLPIMITEWNYAPDAAANDGKNNDASFMTTWTTKALQTLANSGVTAAMQYAATNTNTNLIDATNTLTAQGSAMQEQYETLVSGSSSSVTTTSTDTTTVTPVSDASAAAAPSNVTIPPASSDISEPE